MLLAGAFITLEFSVPVLVPTARGKVSISGGQEWRVKKNKNKIVSS